MLVKKLTLDFENCDAVEIDGKYIGDFYVGDLKKEIGRWACNDISEMTICNTFFVEIHKCAFTDLKTRFGEDALHRIIEWNDITNVSFTIYDQYAEITEDLCEKDYLYYVDYDEEYPGMLGANNKKQTSYISNCGNLYIKVANEPLFKFFDKCEIDDEDCMDFRFSMYDVGEK